MAYTEQFGLFSTTCVEPAAKELHMIQGCYSYRTFWMGRDRARMAVRHARQFHCQEAYAVFSGIGMLLYWLLEWPKRAFCFDVFGIVHMSLWDPLAQSLRSYGWMRSMKSLKDLVSWLRTRYFFDIWGFCWWTSASSPCRSPPLCWYVAVCSWRHGPKIIWNPHVRIRKVVNLRKDWETTRKICKGMFALHQSMLPWQYIHLRKQASAVFTTL